MYHVYMEGNEIIFVHRAASCVVVHGLCVLLERPFSSKTLLSLISRSDERRRRRTHSIHVAYLEGRVSKFPRARQNGRSMYDALLGPLFGGSQKFRLVVL